MRLRMRHYHNALSELRLRSCIFMWCGISCLGVSELGIMPIGRLISTEIDVYRGLRESCPIGVAMHLELT